MAMTYGEAKERLIGIGAHYTTYTPDSDIDAADHVGDLVAITDVGEVGLGADQDAPIGVIARYETDAVSVQDGGYAEIGIKDEASADDELAAGDFIEVDGAGNGAKSTTYKGAICIASDKTNHKAIIKIG